MRSVQVKGSVTAELRTIIELQRTDMKLAELRAAQAAIPRQLAAGRGKLEAAQEAVERTQAELEELQKEGRTRERQIDEAREGQLKSRGRLMEVKTNEEYTALLKEIEYADGQVNQLEEEVLGLMEGVEARHVELKGLLERVKAEQEQFAKEKGTKEEELRRVEAVLQEQEARRAELTGRLAEDLLASYDRIRGNKDGVAAVEVLDGVCQGCNQRIPLQTYINIKNDEIIYFCQGCSRILFHADKGHEG
jgi:predicted  nucleic acid-binding Zn-ribbon protein